MLIRSTMPLLFLAVGLVSQAVHSQAADAESEGERKPVLQQIEDNGKLRVGVNPNFMPFSFMDDSGERVGVDIDIARQLAAALDVELDVVAPESFADLIPQLVDGRIDMILAGMSITFERARTVDFTDPYFDTGMSILMNIGASAGLGIASAEDSGNLIQTLVDKGNEGKLKIAVTQGKAAESVVASQFPDARITRYATNEEAAEATLAGETNLMVHDEIFLKVWLREHASAARNRMIVLDPPIKPDYYGIAVRQGEEEWLRLLDVFVMDLRANDQVVGYMQNYLPISNKASTSDAVAPVFDLEN